MTKKTTKEARRTRVEERPRIERNTSYVAKPLEQMIREATTSSNPITMGATRVYTEAKDGVIPGYNIRTDRFEVGVEGGITLQKIGKLEKEKKETQNTDVQ